MSTDSQKITYEETHENGFLERLLLNRRLTLASAVYFGCAVVAIGLAIFHLYVAAFGTPEGSAGYRRPSVVLQADDFNESPIQTVVVVALTSNLRLAQAPGNVRCGKRDSGLSKPSVVNVSQVATIDKSRLLECVGSLPRRKLEEVEDGVRLVLGL